MKLGLPFVLVPVLFLAMVLSVVVALRGGDLPTPVSTMCRSGGADTQPATSVWDADQMTNATTIVDIGQQRGIGQRGLVVALAAAMQESSLRNLNYGDRDSQGLFQMRPSQGWGSIHQVTDPVYAANAFFGGVEHPPANPGLTDVPGWEQLSITQAAQAVERSGHPDAYAQWEDEAVTLVTNLAANVPACEPGPGVANCPPTGLPVEQGLTANAQRALRCEVAGFGIENVGGRASGGHVSGSDHYTGRAIDVMIARWQTPEGRAKGDLVARYFVANAADLHVTYVIWNARIWSMGRPTWRPYRHPSGSNNPTLQHLDHVHVSVS